MNTLKLVSRLRPRCELIAGSHRLGLASARKLPMVQPPLVRSFWNSANNNNSSEPVDNLSPNSSMALKEQLANRQLSNPNGQADFYRTCLENNYPQVVISRYETPGVARDPSCDMLYASALRKLNYPDRALAVESRLVQGRSQNISHNPQATYNHNSSAIDGNKGTRMDPVHVILSEPTSSAVMRWIRWLVPLMMVGYVGYTGFNLLNEAGGGSIFGGPGGPGGGLGGRDGSGEIGKANLADGTNGTISKVKFSDVHGIDEARAELEEVVDFLKDPSKFTGLGGKLPKGVLLTGPPGTGKTLLARAVAGEAGVPFYFMSGSEFDELYVGVGAKRIRQLFTAARSNSPAIVFIDELDAIGGKRSKKDQSYSKQTLNQLLVELDGFNQTTGIIFIAATNFPETLDSALTRPGRFDKIVNVDLPDVRGRIAILNHHMKKIEIDNSIKSSLLARGTSGFSGAELMNLVNQAAIYASQQKATAVNMSHFEWAKDKILLGAAKKSMVLTVETRQNTAYHEAGHALMALYTPGATNLYKATILPRGRALGITFQLPEMDKYEQTRSELYAILDVCMGGKIAEEILRGPDNVTSGCSSDLQKATSVARSMVTQYGMSDKIGPIDLGSEWASWSPAIRALADEEVRRVLRESEDRTRTLLNDKRRELDRLAQGLVEYETLDKEEIVRVCEGLQLPEREKAATNTIVNRDDVKDMGMKKPTVAVTPGSNATPL
ncbi:ATP-dependent metallopeptidase Hfl [Nadsonia fulvescens var. elongata DSM 6958]|uniref:ATP-dependent metallopeptidase Hfl n=1 Tax=Nadsonia fulvescens var. elongata DSM 6958 TaxID=857566 RepID=A0A1E3PS78_9ASCO|nr:ATP-dependent metallopeptidase Hfl [Nadsonia fulvescens var. elongata DSM 6958]